jgi:hypothetical protein
MTDSVAGTWLVEIPQTRTVLIGAESYTKVGSRGSLGYGYFAGEVHLTSADRIITPSSIAFAANDLPLLPSAKSVTVSSQTAMSALPAISGAPSWLQVTPTLEDANTVKLDNALIGALLPAEGEYAVTLSVLPDGAAEALTYEVALTVGPPPPGLFTIHNPLGGQTYYVGDTLRVRYDADTVQLIGTVIHLSVDGGENYRIIHHSNALPLGEDQEYAYVIPADLFGPYDILTQCIIRLMDYPTGSAVYSPTFTIAKAPSGSRQQSLSQAAANLRLRVLLKRRTLLVASPAPGTARILSIHGRVLQTFRLTGGIQCVAVDRLPAGRHLLQADYHDGSKELAGLRVW